MTLIVEDGTVVPNANSYVSVQYADEYFENHPFHSAIWEDLPEEKKESFLIYATSVIDSMFVWAGWIAEDNQTLAFPRDGIVDSEYRQIPRNSIPPRLKMAVCEQAVSFTNGDPFAASSSEGISELEIDVIKLVFDKSASSSSKVIPASVYQLLAGLGVSRLTRVSRVTVV